MSFESALQPFDNENAGVAFPDADLIEQRKSGLRSGIAFSFDVDGVLLRSGTPLPGASETLQHLTNIGVPFIFLTNGGGSHESAAIAKLSERLNVALSEDQLVQSHTPIKTMVENFRHTNVLVLGGVGNACREVAEQYGFESVITSADILAAYPTYWPYNQINPDYYTSCARPLPAPIDPDNRATSLRIGAIFVFSSPRDWGLDAQLCLDLLSSDGGILGTQGALNGRAGLPNNGWQAGGQPLLHFVNQDFVWATEWPLGPRFAQGAWITALEAIWAEHTSYTATLQSYKLGKPSMTTFGYGEMMLLNRRVDMCQQMEVEPDEAGPLNHVFMIGDNPKSDIDGANGFRSVNSVDWVSMLVETGVWTRGQPDGFPQFTMPDVKSAVNMILLMKGLQTVPE